MLLVILILIPTASIWSLILPAVVPKMLQNFAPLLSYMLQSSGNWCDFFKVTNVAGGANQAI